MSILKENSEKVISLGGIIVSIAIIIFALTYEIETVAQDERVNSVNDKTASDLKK